MKKLLLIPVFVLMAVAAFSQEDAKSMHETARGYMRSGDFDNAILVLNRALIQDKNNLEMQKDLVMTYYLKREYTKALEGAKLLIEREDADVICFQIAGNVYKALEEVKECDKMYKKGLKKFPKSGPLYSEYGELLLSAHNNTAIDMWEKGIQADPAYGGNYYNAALYYYSTEDKVWSIVYGEIFVNMESLSQRGAAMKELLLRAYKEKLFSQASLQKDIDKSKNEFAKAFLTTMNKQLTLTNKGVTVESLGAVRSRFILDWYNTYASKFPYKLFDYQQQLLQSGMFEAYNQWLFGPVDNLAAYDAWTKNHTDQYEAFKKFQANRVFKMPQGQYYAAVASK
jgi:tetratricopeptide (TPR) repeat protein